MIGANSDSFVRRGQAVDLIGGQLGDFHSTLGCRISGRGCDEGSGRNLQFAGGRYILVSDYSSHRSDTAPDFVGTIVMKFFRLLLSLTAMGALIAHPMGNFSVSHYTKISVGARGADLLYVLDL